ncbi:putative colanic acid biosynthesis acetyltransferase [Neorhodopirellula lusitana]|uniref:putative colanic acid biosynthesis acetyltransferase n=1 Tax=Neorhodopirellula lusitana TaxID=445327 RepID=UPI00384E380F
MGDFSVLGDEVDCYTMNDITIGSKVAVSQRAFLCTGSHDVSSLLRPLITAPISIENHAWVAAQAFVGPGVTIGEGAVVGACAGVFKDVAPWHIVGGNPAAFLKTRKINESLIEESKPQ